MKAKFKVGDIVTLGSQNLYAVIHIELDISIQQYMCILKAEFDGVLIFFSEGSLSLYREPIPKLKLCPFCGNKNVIFTNKPCDDIVNITYKDQLNDKVLVCCDACQDGCGAISGHPNSTHTIHKHIELWNSAKR